MLGGFFLGGGGSGIGGPTRYAVASYDFNDSGSLDVSGDGTITVHPRSQAFENRVTITLEVTTAFTGGTTPVARILVAGTAVDSGDTEEIEEGVFAANGDIDISATGTWIVSFVPLVSGDLTITLTPDGSTAGALEVYFIDNAGEIEVSSP